MSKRLLTGLVAAAILPGLLVCLAPSALAKLTTNSRPFVGIMTEPTPEKAEHPGVVIREVAPDSPAAKAGLKVDDVIVKVGDKEVKNFETLAGAVNSHKPGDKLSIAVSRDGKEQNLTVTLGEQQVRALPPMPKFHGEKGGAFLGVHSQDLTTELKDQLGLAADKGVLVTEVLADTPAAKAGIKEQDVITGINDQAVTTAAELRDAIHKAGVGKEVTVKMMRGKDKMEVKAKLEEAPAVASFWMDPHRHVWSDGFSGEMPSFFGNPARIQELEKKVQELEKKVQELQQQLAQPKK